VGEPRFADRIGTVLDSVDADAVTRLADDLSGIYGPFALRFDGESFGDAVDLTGRVLSGGTQQVGDICRRFRRDSESHQIVVHHDLQNLYPEARNQGFGSALWVKMEAYYRRSGVDRIELWAALEDGSFLWAISGYLWDMSPEKLEESLLSVRNAAARMQRDMALAVPDYDWLGAVIESLHPEVDELATPGELALHSSDTAPNLGETLMRQAHWHGVLYL
jgi:GNAT superfamily N-acetyltransferase